jgi:RNA polymerase sigma-70 factor (ECF subfamily)
VETAASALEFRDLYEAEFGYVWSSLRRLGVLEKDIEDLAHDVFITAYRRLGAFDRGRPMRPWLFGICFRLASDFRRRAHHQHEVAEDGQDVADGGRLPDDEVAARQARDQVLRALESLDLDRRAVFVMHEIDGVAVPQIAEALEVPLNTAYSRLRLARQDFATAVRRLAAQGEGGKR